MSFISTSTLTAPSIVIGLGENSFESFTVDLEVEEVAAVVYMEDYWGGCGPELRGLLEGQYAIWGKIPQGRNARTIISSKGDIAQPEAKFWNYSKDVMSLAKSQKREQVNNSEELLFGVELEFNHSSHTLQDLSPLLEMGIFKHDSSVDGEYVTLPYTYSDMVQKITEVASSFDKLLSANDTLTPTSKVGMHVHLSRKGLTDEQLDLLRSLFNGDYAPYISYLCGRYPNSFCEYKEYKHKESRYVALNERNPHTVEIRAFLSPHSAKGLLDYLALIKEWLDNPEGWPSKYPVSLEDLEEWWKPMIPPASPPSPPPSTATSGWEAFDEEAPASAAPIAFPELLEMSISQLEEYVAEIPIAADMLEAMGEADMAATLRERVEMAWSRLHKLWRDAAAEEAQWESFI